MHKGLGGSLLMGKYITMKDKLIIMLQTVKLFDYHSTFFKDTCMGGRRGKSKNHFVLPFLSKILVFPAYCNLFY